MSAGHHPVGVDILSFSGTPPPLNIQNIYHRISLQASHVTNALQLSEIGCSIQLSNGETLQNCSAVCSNPTLLFGTSEQFDSIISHNLFNCLTYGLASDLLSRELLDDEALATISHFGITNDTRVLQKIEDALTSCLGVYCSNSTGCTHQWLAFDWYSKPTLIPNYQYVCDTAPTQLNGDFGGIGVIVAFVLESLIVMLIWFTLRTSRLSLLHNLMGNKKYLAATSKDPPKEWKSALISFLTDFQKSQCTFWLAMGISMLIMTFDSPALLSLRTLGALVNNVAWLKTFNPGGIVLMSFTTHLLISSGNRSWYVFCLSVVSSTILTAAYISFSHLSYSDIVPETHGDWRYACGPVSPATFCTGSGIESAVDFSDPRLSKGLVDNNLPRPDFTAFFSPLVAICFSWFRLLVDFVQGPLWPFVPQPIWLRDQKLAALSTDELLKRLDREVTLKAVVIVIHAVLDFFHIFMIGLFVTVMIVPAGQSTSVTTSRDWSFGQVVAVLVWLPVMTDGCYSMIRGFIKASEHRIVSPFKVIRADDPGRSADQHDVKDPMIGGSALSGLQLTKITEKDGVNSQTYGIAPDEQIPWPRSASSITLTDHDPRRSTGTTEEDSLL